ncbi:MAG TPA: VOC family protein [Acidimicrobiales bacterium]|jgi:catechol 2,3-dioxygenase-like lactoylglutathione lyase family enzyme|nr:VOC family protein [Acidimicrobiales bacterium]
MSTTDGSGEPSTPELRLEVVVVPVSDVDRSKDFYLSLGFRLDVDYVAGDDFRVVQMTPPGSACSVTIGAGITAAVPGSTQGLLLAVNNIEAARAALIGRGAKVSELFHDVGGVFHHAGTEGRVAGPAPDRQSYGSFASFNDPDGNGWLLYRRSPLGSPVGDRLSITHHLRGMIHGHRHAGRPAARDSRPSRPLREVGSEAQLVGLVCRLHHRPPAGKPAGSRHRRRRPLYGGAPRE